MDTLYEIKGNTLIVIMPKDIDHHSANMITEYSDLFVTGNNIKNMVFDFKNTEFMDSSGVGVVISTNKLVRKLGGSLVLKNMKDNIDRIFRISGIYKFINY